MTIATTTLSAGAFADLEAAIDSEIAWHTKRGESPCSHCLDTLAVLEEITRETDDRAMAHIAGCAACMTKPWRCPEFMKMAGIDAGSPAAGAGAGAGGQSA